jgi:hypothetical protein
LLDRTGKGPITGLWAESDRHRILVEVGRA